MNCVSCLDDLFHGCVPEGSKVMSKSLEEIKDKSYIGDQNSTKSAHFYNFVAGLLSRIMLFFLVPSPCCPVRSGPRTVPSPGGVVTTTSRIKHAVDWTLDCG